MAKALHIGDNVLVELPSGKLPGKIFGNAPPYQLSGEERFEVHGKGFVTITSARSITTLCASCGRAELTSPMLWDIKGHMVENCAEEAI